MSHVICHQCHMSFFWAFFFANSSPAPFAFALCIPQKQPPRPRLKGRQLVCFQHLARNFSSSRVASLLKKPKKMLPQAPPRQRRQMRMCSSLSWSSDCAVCQPQPSWLFFVFGVPPRASAHRPWPMADFRVFCSRFLAAPCMSVQIPDLRHRIYAVASRFK